jgi:hypothetical protein
VEASRRAAAAAAKTTTTKKTTEKKDAAEKPASVYYKNCAAVRAAGKAPIRRGDPGYSSKLDADGDGQGCGAD